MLCLQEYPHRAASMAGDTSLYQTCSLFHSASEWEKGRWMNIDIVIVVVVIQPFHGRLPQGLREIGCWWLKQHVAEVGGRYWMGWDTQEWAGCIIRKTSSGQLAINQTYPSQPVLCINQWTCSQSRRQIIREDEDKSNYVSSLSPQD